MKQTLFILLFSIAPLSWADDELPPCEGDQMTWTACSYTWDDGYNYVDKYVGEWKDGKQNGQGTFTWGNGDKYVGQWKDNQQHGKGTYTYAEGGKYVGQWKDGEWKKGINERSTLRYTPKKRSTLSDAPKEKSTLNDVSGIYTCYVSSSTKKDKIRGKDNRGRVIIIESEDRTRYPISISIWHDNRDKKVSEKLGASISYPEALGGKNYIGDVFATGDNIILKYEINPFNKTTAIINRFTGFIEIKPEVFGGWGNIIDGLADGPSVISIKNGPCEKNKRKF